MSDPSPILWLAATILAGFILERLIPVAGVTAVEKAAGWCLCHVRLLACLFFSFSLVGLYLFNRTVLHSFMGSADEYSCYFLAQCLLRGRWWENSPVLSEFFNVVHVGNRDGKWFSVYPPGWPFLLALGLRWNVAEWLNPGLASASLYFLYQTAKKAFGAPSAILGILLTLAAPFFVFTSAAYFSHPTCLLAVSIFFWAYGNWREEPCARPRLVWMTLAATAAGYGLATRYLTLGAFIAPFALFHAVQFLKSREKWTASHTLFLVILATSLFLIFCHNYAVTGNFFDTPNHYDKDWERLGFRDEYTVSDGLFSVAHRIFYLADWVPPAWILMFLISLFKAGKEDVEIRLVRLAFWYPVVAYIFYHSWGGNQFGPRYYYEAYPFFALALADGIVKLWKEAGMGLRKLLLGVLFFSFVNAGFLFIRHGTFYETAYAQRRELYDLAEKTIAGPSIIFIRGFLGDQLVLAQEDAVRNDPGLQGRILYAHDLGEKNRLLMNAYPDRRYYRGSYDRTLKKAVLEKLSCPKK